MSLNVTASYAADPAASTDNHVLCNVTVSNTGQMDIDQVDLQPVEPLLPPYGGAIVAEPFAVAAGETIDLLVGVHIAPDLAPSKPTFTATAVPEQHPPAHAG